jgi:YbaB/EbfC DNA-binding family
MGPGFDSILNETMAELERQRNHLTQLHHSLSEVNGSALSKRRQVSVTVDARGDITELKFHGLAYRKLSPAELADIIVDTIRQAQQTARTTVLESLGDSLPADAEVADIVSGHYDWSAALEEALTLPQSLIDLISSGPSSRDEPSDRDVDSSSDLTFDADVGDSGGSTVHRGA